MSFQTLDNTGYKDEKETACKSNTTDTDDAVSTDQDRSFESEGLVMQDESILDVSLKVWLFEMLIQ